MAAQPFDFFKTPKDPAPGWKIGMLEDFGFGWNKETTYDGPRNQALSLLDHSKTCSTAEDQQALLQCSVILLTSGLESFFQFVASHHRTPSPHRKTSAAKRSLKTPKQKARTRKNEQPSLRQSFGDYERIAKRYSNYKEINGRDRTAITRMFLVRHAIVHHGGRITKTLRKNLNGNVYRSETISLDAPNIAKVIEATDRFVESVCLCDGTLRALVI